MMCRRSGYRETGIHRKDALDQRETERTARRWIRVATRICFGIDDAELGGVHSETRIDSPRQGTGNGRIHIERIAYLAPNSFVVREIEPFALDDWSTDGRSKLVKNQGRRFCGRKGNRIKPVIEVISRIERRIAAKVIRGSVDLVGAGFDSDIHHDSGLFSEIGLRLFLRVEFLNGIERQGARRSPRNPGVVHHGFPIVSVVIGGSVDNKIVVVWTKSVGGYGVESPARLALHAGMKRQQVLEVPPLKRKLIDCLVR